MTKYVVAVDVGTGSARAGVFDEAGTLLGHGKRPIEIVHRDNGQVEQDSSNIWASVCAAVRDAVAASGIAGSAIAALAFDATCSLVLADREGAPLPLNGPNWDVIVWMDQRAIAEADECTATGSVVLDYLGGTMSPQMQMPKLKWVKRHRPDIWDRIGYAFDLADYLSWRATGSNDRSVCTLGCKWTYVETQEGAGWRTDFLSQVGLEDVLGKAALPERANAIGERIGPLTEQSAVELGLSPQCIVATGLIDAHAGALGTLAPLDDVKANSVLALIAGSSNCHMALSRDPREVAGVWGPYYGAVLDKWWVNEGGQSATGLLLDWVVRTSSATIDMDRPHEELSAEITKRIAAGQHLPDGFHIAPDVLGNRSPFADANMLGVVVGVTMADPLEHAVLLYWATAAAIGYGTRQIIDRLNTSGYAIDTIALSGGHAVSKFLVQLYADTTGCNVLLSSSDEPVLLGTAFVAHAALVDSIDDMGRMVGSATVICPDRNQRLIHDVRYSRFCQLLTFSQQWSNRGRIT